MNKITLVFSMIWLMEISKIQQEEQPQDNVLREKPFNIARNPKYDGNERVFAAILGKCFDKKSKGGGANNEVKQNEKLAEELHKPIIEKFKKRKVYSSFKDNIWGAYLADMQLISKFNK